MILCVYIYIYPPQNHPKIPTAHDFNQKHPPLFCFFQGTAAPGAAARSPAANRSPAPRWNYRWCRGCPEVRLRTWGFWELISETGDWIEKKHKLIKPNMGIDGIGI